MRFLIFLAFTILAASCSQPKGMTEKEKQEVIADVKQTLDNYYRDINQYGIMGELPYLDTSADFFWVPPGYNGPISYDSVIAVLRTVAPLYSSVKNSFDTLRVIAVSSESACYTAKVTSTMTDTAGNVTKVSLVETGVMILRDKNWKLLSGQTSAVPSSTTDAVSISGSGDTTLVFVHGWCINKSYWDDQVSVFRKNYKVVTIDLAGHGKSTVKRDNWTLDNYATDVVDVINEYNLKNIVLIGHSMSGDINLLVNERLPEKIIGFIGVDNFQELAVVMPDSIKVQSEAILDSFRNDYKNMSEQYAQSLFSRTTELNVRKRVTSDVTEADPVMSVGTLRSIMNMSARERKLCKKVRVPLILINSDIAPVNKDQLREHFSSGYKIFLIPGTGHYPMVEKPREFNNALKEALKFIGEKALR